MRERKEAPNYIPSIPTTHVIAIVQLLLATSEFSVENIKEMVNLSLIIILEVVAQCFWMQ